VGFRFQVELPEGLTFVEDPENEGNPWYDDTLTSIEKLNITATANGAFAATPRTAKSTISGTQGVLMRVKVKAAENLAKGTTLTVKLTDVSVNHRDENYNVSKTTLPDVAFSVTVALPDVGPKGDVNGDSKVNVGDIMAVINVMAGLGGNNAKGDVNGDGKVNVGDIMAVINIMAGK
jgi:biopolymer transport protein ExbD